MSVSASLSVNVSEHACIHVCVCMRTCVRVYVFVCTCMCTCVSMNRLGSTSIGLAFFCHPVSVTVKNEAEIDKFTSKWGLPFGHILLFMASVSLSCMNRQFPPPPWLVEYACIPAYVYVPYQ